MLELGLAARTPSGHLERRQQHLGDRALDRAHGEALLQLAVRGGLVEVVEGGEQARGRGRAAAALAGDLDGAGDVARLLQRLAQRLDLAQLVDAVVARGAPRVRIAETALPAAQGAGADAEHLGRRIDSETTHR